jgi:hypothetical protein
MFIATFPLDPGFDAVMVQSPVILVLAKFSPSEINNSFYLVRCIRTFCDTLFEHRVIR